MTFQSPSKSFTARDYQFIGLVTILFLVVSTALVYANLTLTGGGDFYTHWVASRGFIFDKIDPYSGQVPSRVQELVYGDSAQPGDEPYILDTPFQILLLYFPFSLLSDPLLARALYTLLLELALFALALLSLRLTNWEAPRFFSILCIFFCVANFYAFQAILEASPVIVLGLFYTGILLALRAEQDELAGALMAVSLYYWEVGGAFLIFVAWRAYREGRSRFFAGFGMIAFVLLAVSFLVYPNWIIPYLRAGMNNLRADFGYSTQQIFTHLFFSQNGTYAWIFIGILIFALGYEWNAAIQADQRRFYWTACLSLAVAPLLGFRSEMEHLVVLVIPFTLIFSVVHDRWSRIGFWVTPLLLLIVFLLPWSAFFFALPFFGEDTGEIVFLFFPLSTIIGLYWIRWWAIRPPRIWSDLIAHRE